LSPQLEANRPHPLGRFYAFLVGVEPPPLIAGLAFIRQNEFEGVSADINVSFHLNILIFALYFLLRYKSAFTDTF
jgi:hypothetical protein